VLIVHYIGPAIDARRPPMSTPTPPRDEGELANRALAQNPAEEETDEVQTSGLAQSIRHADSRGLVCLSLVVQFRSFWWIGVTVHSTGEAENIQPL